MDLSVEKCLLPIELPNLVMFSRAGKRHQVGPRGFIPQYLSGVRCHVSCVMCHMSQVKNKFNIKKMNIFQKKFNKVVELVSGGFVINGAYPV